MKIYKKVRSNRWVIFKLMLLFGNNFLKNGKFGCVNNKCSECIIVRKEGVGLAFKFIYVNIFFLESGLLAEGLEIGCLGV